MSAEMSRVYALIGRVAALEALASDPSGGDPKQKVLAELEKARRALLEEPAAANPDRAVIVWKLRRAALGRTDSPLIDLWESVAQHDDVSLDEKIRWCFPAEFSPFEAALLTGALAEAGKLSKPGRR
jgi:hypothetical protein